MSDWFNSKVYKKFLDKSPQHENLESNWFNNFPHGIDSPGSRHFRDKVEHAKWNSDNKDATNKQRIDQLGWTDTNVTYNINEWGYRGQIQPGNSVNAAFGCSHTFGAAVNESHHWPGILELTNCGQPGSSNDKIVRIAISYINTFSPKSIYVLWTYNSRREWIDAYGKIYCFKSLSPAEKEAQLKTMDFNWQTSHIVTSNDTWDEYNYEKNKLLLSSFCKSKEVKLNEISVYDHPHGGYARDLQHPGADWHAAIAAELSEY
jgi:hypothetical protein